MIADGIARNSMEMILTVLLCGTVLMTGADAAPAATSTTPISMPPPETIRLKSETVAEQKQELREYYRARNPKLKVDTMGFDAFCDAMMGSKPRKFFTLKDVTKNHRYYGTYVPMEDSIMKCRAPDAFKEQLQRYWIQIDLWFRTVGFDTEEVAAVMAAIPSGWEAVSPTNEQSLVDEVDRRCGKFAGVAPADKKRMLDWIAAFNPYLRSAGYYMADAKAVREPSLHAILPVDKRRVQVCLYQFYPLGLVLLPANPAGLKDLPAVPPASAYDVSPPAVEGPISPRRLVLGIDAAEKEKPRLCTRMELTLWAPEADGPIVRGYAVRPLFGNLPTSLGACRLAVAKGKLSGTFTFDGWDYTLNAAIDGSSIAGGVQVAQRGGRDASVKTQGRVAGLVLPVAQLDDPARLAAAVKGAAAMGISCVGTSTIAQEYPRPLGPAGSGAIPGIAEPMVRSLDAARFCWRSEEETPGSYGVMTQAGYAAPVVAHGNVYQVIAWPRTDDPWNADVVKKWLAEINADGRYNDDSLRQKWAISADDVVLCLDGRTGLTRWKTVFAGKGSNHGQNARGPTKSTKSGPVGTPSVVDGRIFFRGSSGRAYALDALTGAVIWESTIGGRHDLYEARKRQCRRYQWQVNSGYELCSSVGVAGGVVALNDHGTMLGLPLDVLRIPSSLIGLDAANGKLLWTRIGLSGGFATPMRWSHKGREFFVVPGPSNTVHCIDPPTGASVWVIPEAGFGHKTALDEDHLLVADSVNGNLTCYRITPEKATRLWPRGTPAELKGFANAAIVNGMVVTVGEELKCFDLETGRFLKQAKGGSYWTAPLVNGNQIVVEGGGLRMYRLTGDEHVIEELGDVYPIPLSTCVSPAIADGRVIARGNDGVYCFDLRKDPGWWRRRAAGLMGLLGCGDPALETKAVRALTTLDADALSAIGADAGPAILSLVNSLGHSDGTMVLACSTALRRMGTVAVGELIKGLGSGNALVAARSAGLLGRIQPTARNAAAPLAKALKHSDTNVRNAACTALMTIDKTKESAVITALAESVRSSDENAARAAATTLSRFGPKVEQRALRMDAVAALVEVLRGGSEEMKQTAMVCLSAFGPEAEPAANLIQEAIFAGKFRDDAIAAMKKVRPGKPIQLRPKIEEEEDDDMPDLDL